MFMNKTDLTDEEYQKEKKAIENVTVNLSENKAGIIISKTNNGFINFGMFGNGEDIVLLIREQFVRLPEKIRKYTLKMLIEDEYAKSNGLETQAPVNNRLN